MSEARDLRQCRTATDSAGAVESRAGTTPAGLLIEISGAQTCGELLAAATQPLCSLYGVRAMALECGSGSSRTVQRFGDPAFTALPEMTPSGFRVDRYPIGLRDYPAELLFVLPDEAQPDVQVLSAVASQAGLRLRLTDLHQRLDAAEDRARHRVDEVAAIYETGQALDKAELPGLLRMITFRAARLLDSQVCAVLLVHTDSAELRIEAAFGLPDVSKRHAQKAADGLAGQVIRTEQPLLVPGGTKTDAAEVWASSAAGGPCMLVPLKSQEGAVLGVLATRRKRGSADYEQDDLKLFSAFASQAALALTNVRLYDDLRQRASELLKLSSLSRVLISTLNPEELLGRVADDIRATVGFDRCCLYIRDPRKGMFVPRVLRGYPPAVGRNPVKEGEGAVGTVARMRLVVQFDARQATPSEPARSRVFLQQKGFARSLGTDSFVAVPIISGQDRCIGVVVADNRLRRAPISSEQVNLLTAFVNHAGIAIENARLYEELQENFRNTHRLKTYIDSVFESIGAGIVATDTSGNILRWNRAATDILLKIGDNRRQDSLHDTIAHLKLPETERHYLRDLVQRAMFSEESIHLHKYMLHPRDGQPVAMNLILSRLVDHNGDRAGVVLIFEDVTMEVQLEAEVEKMRRLADIGQLAAKMAHEVRNALSPIKGAAQIIRSDLEVQSTSTEWTDIIIAEVDGLSRLTSEMLDFARPMPMNLQPVSLGEFLYASVQTISSFLEENETKVHWQMPMGLPDIQADPVYLGQVVRNIVMNASQAMPEGGELFVGVSHERSTDTVCLKFSDTGVGIPRQDLERIFRPFVTTKTKGTGLGLPIVQKIVDHHGGRISVDSTVGVGTTFSIWLPIRSNREAPDDTSEVIGAAPGTIGL